MGGKVSLLSGRRRGCIRRRTSDSGSDLLGLEDESVTADDDGDVDLDGWAGEASAIGSKTGRGEEGRTASAGTARSERRRAEAASIVCWREEGDDGKGEGRLRET